MNKLFKKINRKIDRMKLNLIYSESIEDSFEGVSQFVQETTGIA